MKKLLIAFFTCFVFTATASQLNASFDVVVVGSYGGINEADSTAFLIHPKGDFRAIMCDVGSLVNGLEVAVKKQNAQHLFPNKFSGSKASYILKQVIKGYLVSHAHLDHISGLIFASPDDNSKPIYASKATLGSLKTSVFNWDLWPNFADQGVEPHLNKYNYVTLPFSTPTSLTNTAMSVTAYPLSHNSTESTAFLIEHNNHYLLCMGDTGPDVIEKSNNLMLLWHAIAPLIERGALKGIIIESSFPNSREDSQLYGHLTPAWIQDELARLSSLLDQPSRLRNVPFIVSHVKYTLNNEEDPRMVIQNQLEKANRQKLQFIIALQGQRIQL